MLSLLTRRPFSALSGRRPAFGGDPLARGLVGLLDGQSAGDLLNRATVYQRTSISQQIGREGNGWGPATRGFYGLSSPRYDLTPSARNWRQLSAPLTFAFFRETNQYTAATGVEATVFGAWSVTQLYGTGNRSLVLTTTGGTSGIVTGGVFPLNTPVLNVLTWDGQTLKAYENGALLGTSACTGTPSYGTSFSRHYAFGSGDNVGAAGLLYYMALWADTCFSSREQEALWSDPMRIVSPGGWTLLFDLGAAGDTYSLTATGLAGGTPALDAPALTQNHGVTASNIVGTAPTLGSPALSQNHALTANNLAGTAPTLGTPAVTLAGTLVANDITGTAPVLANAVLTQNHALTATAIGGTAATLGTPALTQNHVVTAANLTGSAPVLGTPTVVLGGTLLADNILGATPTLGSPALTQNHALTASPLLGAAPILGSPAFGQQHLLTGSNIVGAAPTLGQPDLTSGSSGGTGATVEDIVAGMMAALNATTIPVDVQKVNAVTIYGSGTDLDPWRESP